MGSDKNCDLGFQQRDRIGSFLNCPSSGMFMTPRPDKVVETTMNSMSLCESSNGVDSFFSTGWDPMMHNGEFKGSSMTSQPQISLSPYGAGVLQNQGVNNTSHLVQYPSDPRLLELAPKFPCFGSGNFSDMVSSFGLSERAQISNAGCPSSYTSMKEGLTENNSRNSMKITADHGSLFQTDHPISDEGAKGTSPNGKKRKKNAEAEVKQQKDVSSEENDAKKQKTGKHPDKNLNGNSTGKQAKESSQSGEAPKEDYIHVRARRGQATNSHSLAERVRREKISERMRLLQDLVPGCNKITGKAVMLDEIINYVQSLQQQVEFLSMKLATVNPELNVDIEQLLSKEILHSRGLSSALLGFGPGMNTTLPPHLTQQRAMQTIQCTDSQLPTIPQTPNVWDDELQSMIQMGFIPNPALENLGLNGNMKVEL